MIMSRSIYNSTYRLGLYTFTPSYSLCILTSRHRVRCSSGLKQLAKHHSQVTYTPCKAPQKAVVCLFVFVVMDDKRERQNLARANSEFFGIRIRHASNFFAVFALELLVIQLHTLCLGLYFFAHSSRYDFSPSR